MKQLFISAFSLFLFLSTAQAQNKLMLELEPRLGAAPFTLGVPVSAGSYEYKISRLEYYISEIKITHDGGQLTPITDLFLIVRPAGESIYDLGEQPGITNVEAITFSIGVDTAYNHLDPTSYHFKHPLAPQDPSMHWGWSAGYRFVVIEGTAGSNFTNDFQIHALGDVNYKTTTLGAGAENQANGDKLIHLIADYKQVLTGIDVSAGLFIHSFSSDKVAQLMDNMRDLVFSAATSATVHPAFEGNFALAPNPAHTGRTTASMSLPAGFDYRISLTDLTGRVILNQNLAANAQSFVFENQLNAGAYLVQLWQNERPVAVEKLIVTQ